MPPRSTKNMPPGLRAYWRKKNGQRRARAASRSTPRRSRAARRVSKRSNMPRKKGRFGGRKQKDSWTDLAVKAHVVIQAAEPFVPAALQAAAGDVPGAIASARPALKEATSVKNIGQMAIPFIARGVVRKVSRMFGATSPKVGGRRLF